MVNPIPLIQFAVYENSKQIYSSPAAPWYHEDAIEIARQVCVLESEDGTHTFGLFWVAIVTDGKEEIYNYDSKKERLTRF